MRRIRTKVSFERKLVTYGKQMESHHELVSFHQIELALRQKAAPDCSHAMIQPLHLKFSGSKICIHFSHENI